MYVLSPGINEGIEAWRVSYKQRWEQESRLYGFYITNLLMSLQTLT